MLPIYTNQGQGWRRIIKKLSSCGPFGSGIISLFGCNFQCPFCFAQKYSYAPLDSAHKKDFVPGDIANAIIEWSRDNPKSCYLQITGGEPILNEVRINDIVQALIQADRVAQKDLRIIYQTNGSFLGKQNQVPPAFNSLGSLKRTAILFEISFKGTNPNEYSILSGTSNPDGFYNQCKSYWLLKSLVDKNISVVARLGCGHHKNTIHFVNPDKDARSMFLHQSWDAEFSRIHEDMSKTYGKKTMLAECINAEGDGAAHSYLHRSIPAIERCLKIGCITTRNRSKAIERICSQGHIHPPTHVNPGHFNNAYLEFLRYFEPMGEPAHGYCGRNEFLQAYRKSCNNCQFL